MCNAFGVTIFSGWVQVAFLEFKGDRRIFRNDVSLKSEGKGNLVS